MAVAATTKQLHAYVLPQPMLDSTDAVHAAPLIVLIEQLSIFLAM